MTVGIDADHPADANFSNCIDYVYSRSSPDRPAIACKYSYCNYAYMRMVVDKPAEIFDRDVEWDELVRFAHLPQSGATLGVVSGRRRQGKTFLLDALIRSGGGFMFTATE